MTEPWLSANDNAAHLGITKVAIYSWTAEKNMSTNKIDRLWKFQATENDGGAVAAVRRPRSPHLPT